VSPTRKRLSIAPRHSRQILSIEPGAGDAAPLFATEADMCRKHAAHRDAKLLGRWSHAATRGYGLSVKRGRAQAACGDGLVLTVGAVLQNERATLRFCCGTRRHGKPESKTVRVILRLADAKTAGAVADRAAADFAGSIGRVVNAGFHLVSGRNCRDVDSHSGFVMNPHSELASMAIGRYSVSVSPTRVFGRLRIAEE